MEELSLRILHTSDWHIGRTLYGRRRYDEFAAFFNWLYDTIVEQQVDILLVAGDVFHTTTPSNRAQQLYYDFLCRVAASSCRHLVVTAGNHDSPTFLSAPRELLRALNIHVLAALPSSPVEEVLVLKNQAGDYLSGRRADC
ncbi:MAG: exonuclease subunit SbcD [Candidatus Electrothrix sp. Rat3]|nr:exonuclease subunit SbcD [Candidatus Electrothrix rattekaaiensis]